MYKIEQKVKAAVDALACWKGTMSDISDDDEFVRRCIWECLLEARPFITKLEKDELEIFGDEWTNPDMYTMISDAFVYPVLRPALAATQSNVLTRCALLIEDLLASGRPQVIELVSIRVTDQLLGFPELWEKFSKYAGILMLLEVELRRKYYK